MHLFITVATIAHWTDWTQAKNWWFAVSANCCHRFLAMEHILRKALQFRDRLRGERQSTEGFLWRLGSDRNESKSTCFFAPIVQMFGSIASPLTDSCNRCSDRQRDRNQHNFWSSLNSQPYSYLPLLWLIVSDCYQLGSVAIEVEVILCTIGDNRDVNANITPIRKMIKYKERICVTYTSKFERTLASNGLTMSPNWVPFQEMPIKSED